MDGVIWITLRRFDYYLVYVYVWVPCMLFSLLEKCTTPPGLQPPILLTCKNMLYNLENQLFVSFVFFSSNHFLSYLCCCSFPLFLLLFSQQQTNKQNRSHKRKEKGIEKPLVLAPLALALFAATPFRSVSSFDLICLVA